MKQLASEIRDRLALLRLSIRHSYRIETAYFAENWFGLLSTIAYTVTYVLFIDVLFRNVTTFAGYTRGEFLFFTFVTQCSYYLTWAWSVPNIHRFCADVRNGNLDLLLAKPIPILFHVLTRHISIVKSGREAIPTLSVLATIIPWHDLDVTPERFVGGLLLAVLGQLTLNAVQSTLGFAAFWAAGAEALTNVSNEFFEKFIPADSLPVWYATVFGLLIPILLSAAVTFAVMLGRLPVWPTVALGFLATLFALTVRQILWRVALRSYTSASS